MPENQPPDKTVPKPTLGERIEREAARRADRYAQEFDLLALVPFEGLEFNDEEEIQIHGKYVSRGEIITTLDQLSYDLRNFLAARLRTKLAERFREQILSAESPEIDISSLQG